MNAIALAIGWTGITIAAFWLGVAVGGACYVIVVDTIRAIVRGVKA